jgi:hypothetical protein
MKQGRYEAAALLGLFAITVTLFWKIALTSQYTWMNGPDYVNQVVPWFEFQAREWHAGRFPLWDPYHWGGQPLPGQMQPGAMYPLNWLLFLLPLNNGFLSIPILHWYQVLIHFIGAAFCYWLCRDLGRSRMASVLGGTIFGMSGYLGTTDWPQMVNGVVWAPLVLMFFLRVRRGERPVLHSALCGAALGISFLSGHHQAPTFMSLMIVGLWVQAILVKKFPFRRAVVLMGIFGLFVALCGAAQVLPAIEFGKIAMRWVGAKEPVGWADPVPYPIHSQYSLNPVSVLGLIFPDIATPTIPFMGITAIVVAIVAVMGPWKYGHVRLLTGAAVAGLILALGSTSAFHGVLYALIPGVEKARSPASGIFLFNLMAAALAAHGFDALLDLKSEVPSIGRIQKVLCGIAVVVYVFLFATNLFEQGKLFYQLRSAAVALSALLLAALLAGWQSGAISARTVAYSLIGLTMLDLSGVVGYPYTSREQGWTLFDKLYSNQDIISYIRKGPPYSRFLEDREELPYNLGDWWGIEQFDGYTGITTNIVHVNGGWQIYDLMGVEYYIGKKPMRPDETPVFTGTSGMILYKNPNALERTWIAHHVTTVGGEKELQAALMHQAAELKNDVVLVKDAPQVATCDVPDRQKIDSYGQSRISIIAQMGCSGMLVLADTFTPGWNATVDGSPVRIYEAYGVIRAVVVPAGTHKIEFRYRPNGVIYGSALTLIGFLLLPALPFVDRRFSKFMEASTSSAP